MKTPKTTWGLAGKIYAFTLLTALMCFFLHLSITMMLSISSTELLGKRTSGVLEDGRTLIVEEWNATAEKNAYRRIFIVDGEGNETLLEEKEYIDTEEGADSEEEHDILADYPVTSTFSENIRSEVNPGLKNLSNWVAQLLMAILFIAFPYSNMWYAGDHDRNSVQFGHRADDPWRGVRIGLLADIPALLAWVGLIVCKVTDLYPLYIVRYRWVNVCFWPYFNQFIPGDVMNTADVSWGGTAAMLPILLALPLITGIGYILGYREVSLRDRLVYTATGKRARPRSRR